MPEIGRQLRQQALDILAGAVPSQNAVNCCGVPEIVQPWQPQLSCGAFDTCDAANALKDCDNVYVQP